MLYRSLGSSDIKVSAVSFGAMRWPSEAACHAIINRGLDMGLNYVDTSTSYVEGKSLGWTGRAVRGRREQILFSCKCSFGKAPSADDVRAAIEKSLKESGLDYFDFWLLWGLGTPEVLAAARARGGTIEGVRRAQREGLIRLGMGFTFHGPAEVFRAAIDSGEFLSATVSYNLMNRQEEENIAYAAGRGVGLVVMNPLAGGVLGLAGDDSLRFLHGGGCGPCYGALRFLHANAGITTGIVGFRAAGEVDQAVASLVGAERLDEAFRREQMRQMDAVKLIEGSFCTGCGYCKECPHGFKPARFMQAMRDFARYGVAPERLAEWIHSKYPHQDPVAHLALCQECGECEGKCPQHLAIVEQVRRAKAALKS